MTVSSGYENKGYDGDNPVKVIIFAELNHFFHRNKIKHFLSKSYEKKHKFNEICFLSAPIT